MQRKKFVGMLALLAALVLSACGSSDADATPTVSVQLIRTQAVMTYQAQTTQTALAKPTSTPTATVSPTPPATFSAPTVALGGIGTGTAALVTGGQASTCYAMAYVKDVTIPDGTQMTPGQTFTKTWLVSNSGTCAWESGFKFNLVSGDAMGGSAVTINERVEAGRQYEISVPMTAPANKSGKLTGYWRMSDANGSYFGDQVYVEINVGGSASSAASATATTGTGGTVATATATATSIATATATITTAP